MFYVFFIIVNLWIARLGQLQTGNGSSLKTITIKVYTKINIFNTKYILYKDNDSVLMIIEYHTLCRYVKSPLRYKFPNRQHCIFGNQITKEMLLNQLYKWKHILLNVIWKSYLITEWNTLPGLNQQYQWLIDCPCTRDHSQKKSKNSKWNLITCSCIYRRYQIQYKYFLETIINNICVKSRIRILGSNIRLKLYNP